MVSARESFATLNIEYSVEMTRLIKMILEDGKAIGSDEIEADQEQTGEACPTA